MPIYKYSAIDNKGNLQRATVVAANQTAAANLITAKGLTPMEMKEVDENAGFDMDQLLVKLGRVRSEEILLFLRMMSALLGSGITITEAIGVLHDQTINRKFKFILGEIKMQIEGGVSFSDALEQFPRVFPNIVVSMIRAGEAGGILDAVLLDLVVFLEKRAALKKMLLRSFIYPGVVLIVAIGVVIFLVTFVIPRFTVLLQGSKLPWNTQFLLDVSDFMIANAKQLIIGTVGSIAALVVLLTSHQTKRAMHGMLVHLPIFGKISQLGVIVQFARTLGSLLTSGIPLVESLLITKGTLGNQVAQAAVEEATEKVTSGEQLSEVLSHSAIFTSLLVSMVRIGEQSGNLDKQVLLVADIYEQQLEDRVKWMSSMIEPMLIIFLGGVVGFVAWALVAGMLAIYQNAG